MKSPKTPSNSGRREFRLNTPFNERINKEHKDLIKQVKEMRGEMERLTKNLEQHEEMTRVLKETRREMDQILKRLSDLRQEFNQDKINLRSHVHLTKQSIQAIHSVLDSQVEAAVQYRNTIQRVYEGKKK